MRIVAERKYHKTAGAYESQLKRYDVTVSEDFPEYLLVRCPHKDCPSHTSSDGMVRPFLVHRRSWRRPLHSVIKPDLVMRGRSCPYCYKVSLPISPKR
jgi:hypothetical protein